MKTYPFCIRGIHHGSSILAVAKSNCPMRLSKQVMAAWDTDVRHGRRELLLNRFGVTIPFTEDKFPAIDIVDMGIKAVRKQRPLISDGYNSILHGGLEFVTE